MRGRGFLALQVLQTQLQLHDPLLLVVRAELAGVSGQLLCAVALEQESEVSNFSLKLLVRLHMLCKLIGAAIVRAASRHVVVRGGPRLPASLLAFVTLLSSMLLMLAVGLH